MADSSFTKALAVGSYFLSGCLAVNISQILGAPIYLLNRDWYNAWIAFTKQSFGLLTTTLTQWLAPTVVRISGDKSVRGQLLKTIEGDLICDFPQRLVLIANHQIYTDWLYLWWIAYTNGMHGRIYIVLKESLKRIPVIGWGMQLSQFIFLKRNWEKDKPHMAAHLQKLNNPSDPMWLTIFPEGTNLAPSTRKLSKRWAVKNGLQDMQHQLLPRSTGLQFCLQQMRQTVDYVYDCTIAYEGVQRGQYAQDIFTIRASYLESKPPKSVSMYWRRFAVSSIPIDNSKAFEQWLRNRWTEKDNLLEYYMRTGYFPADDGVETTSDGRTIRGAGYIETEIKASRWYEFLQIFAPIGLISLVMYAFYNALPKGFLKSINPKAIAGKVGSVQRLITTPSKKLLAAPNGKAPNNQVESFQKAAMILKAATKNDAVQKAIRAAMMNQKVDVKTLTAELPALMNGSIGKKAMSAQLPTITNGNVGKTLPISRAAPKAILPAPPAQLGQTVVNGKTQQVKPGLSIQKVEMNGFSSSTPKKLGDSSQKNASPMKLQIKPKTELSPKAIASAKAIASPKTVAMQKSIPLSRTVASSETVGNSKPEVKANNLQTKSLASPTAKKSQLKPAITTPKKPLKQNPSLKPLPSSVPKKTEIAKLVPKPQGALRPKAAPSKKTTVAPVLPTPKISKAMPDTTSETDQAPKSGVKPKKVPVQKVRAKQYTRRAQEK